MRSSAAEWRSAPWYAFGWSWQLAARLRAGLQFALSFEAWVEFLLVAGVLLVQHLEDQGYA
ncbi:MAG: hypothetical protein ACREOD_01180 [Candidatus Dormibacteria bacterium]